MLRRLLRRIIRAAKLLGVEEPIMSRLMTTVRDEMGPSYPELVTDFDRIHRIAVAEETAFNRTLVAGSGCSTTPPRHEIRRFRAFRQ